MMVINIQTISPFPWKKERAKILSADGSLVATVVQWDVAWTRYEDIANANVITAAPNLYKELKYAVECIKEGLTPNEKWLERAEHVISRIEEPI